MTTALLEIEGKEFQLNTGQIYIIGGPTCVGNASTHLKLEDDTVDAKHAVLRVDHASANLYDLCSESGTFVNGLKLEPLVNFTVKEMVRLRLGTVEGKLTITISDEFRNCNGVAKD